MYGMKTGALFQAAARIGAILAGAGEELERAAGEWGSLFGYAYQVLDDIEDLDQSDKEQEKDTLARETSPEEARREAAEALRRSLEILQVFGGRAKLVEKLTRHYLAKSRM
jgi:geranylgeranyl diphosphate synthase type II